MAEIVRYERFFRMYSFLSLVKSQVVSFCLVEESFIACNFCQDDESRSECKVPPEPGEVARAYAGDIQDYFSQHPSLWR